MNEDSEEKFFQAKVARIARIRRARIAAADPAGSGFGGGAGRWAIGPGFSWGSELKKERERERAELGETQQSATAPSAASGPEFGAF